MSSDSEQYELLDELHGENPELNAVARKIPFGTSSELLSQTPAKQRPTVLESSEGFGIVEDTEFQPYVPEKNAFQKRFEDEAKDVPVAVSPPVEAYTFLDDSDDDQQFPAPPTTTKPFTAILNDSDDDELPDEPRSTRHQSSQLKHLVSIRPKWAIKSKPINSAFVEMRTESGDQGFVRLRSDASVSQITQALQLKRKSMGTSTSRIDKMLEEIRAEKVAKELQVEQRMDDLEPAIKAGSQLWVEKYKPQRFSDLVSDGQCNRQLLQWIKSWDSVVFDKSQSSKPEFKVALVTGDPGTGKTTVARVLAEMAGYAVREVNASDDRSGKFMHNFLQDASSMQPSFIGGDRPNCLILDEIDGTTGGDENSAIAALLAFVKNPKASRPIICIANDLYAKNLAPLRRVAQMFAFVKPRKAVLVSRLSCICIKEGLRFDMSSLEALADLADLDVRACINALQFVSLQGKDLNVSVLKSLPLARKDASVNLFDTWRALLHQSSKGVPSFADVLSACASSDGDHDLLNMGVFENIPFLKYTDPSLIKTARAFESISAVDMFESFAVRNSLYFATNYSACAFASMSKSVASNHFSQKIKFPKVFQEYAKAGVQNTETSRAVWRSSQLKVSQLQFNVEVVPFLSVILTPNITLTRTSMLNDADTQLLKRTAAVINNLGLTYVKVTADFLGTPSASTLELQPDILALCKYTSGSRKKTLSEGVKLKIQSQCCLLTAKGDILESESPTGFARGSERSVAEPGPLKRKPSGNTWLGAPGAGSGPKSKKGKVEQAAKFSFHEGFTNAVRRPLLMKDVLRGLP